MFASRSILRTLVLMLIGVALTCVGASAQTDAPPKFPEAVSHVKPPSKPAHRTWFVDEPMPATGRTTYIDSLNNILGNCLDAETNGETQGTWADLRRSEYFGMYAIWGLTSPDSKHTGREQLGELLCMWMDERYPSEASEFRADWKAWYLYGPLVEITARPALRKLVGANRLNRAVKRVLEDARDLAERRWPKAAEESVKIVNFGGHGNVAALTLGWVLAREYEPELAPALFERAAFAMRMMDWHMWPNGTIRYLYNPDFSEPQLVGETMYYHNINIRAIYLHWWFTGDELSLKLLERQRPYYRFRMMPWAGRGGDPHSTHYHSAIWWKELWRAFWPGAVALSAAATGDGELATIALTMAEQGTGADRKFADWAVHGYKQMALRQVQPQPRRDNFVIADPDIGGLRMRYGQFSSVFSSNSFSFTLAGTMTPQSGLASAYPLVRLDPLASNLKYEYTNFHIAGWGKPAAMLDIHEAGNAAAAAGAYTPHEQRSTWRKNHVSGRWRVQQLWLYRPDRIIGLMVLRATGDTKARSAEHIYKLMADQVTSVRDASYDAGDLRVTIGATNLPHVLIEPARRMVMSKKEPWRQIVLSDRLRPTKPKAREQAGNNDELLPLRDYKTGQAFYSLVEIRRIEAPAARLHLHANDEQLLAFSAEIGEQAFFVAANFANDGARKVPWRGNEWSIPTDAVKLIQIPQQEQ